MFRFLIVSMLIVLLAACAGLGAGGGAVTGSGNLVSRPFDLDGFSRIDVNDSAQVEVTRGPFSVTVETDDNLVPRLDVSVVGDTLQIGLQEGSYNNGTLRARVTMPELTGVTLNGGSALRGEAAGEDLAVNLNGGSQATLTGTAGRVTVDVNGGSNVLLGDLAARDVDLSANGGSHIEINASGTVSGSANGGSNVTVTGSPASVDVQTDGGSQVTTR